LGPSYAYKFSDTFSVGITLNYFFRKYRKQQYQLIEFSDTTDNALYYNTDWTEHGIFPKVGLMWSPIAPISIGFVIDRIFLTKSTIINQSNQKAQGTDDVNFTTATGSFRNRSVATHLGLGIAYFASPFLLFALDFDYYIAGTGSTSQISSTPNFSLGSEYFINEHHAVRLGFFTNLTNKNILTKENINLYGFSAGYSFYQRATSITFGIISSFGSGTAQIYEDSSNTIPVSRYSYTGVVSANFGF
jgi:hypothetical protein